MLALDGIRFDAFLAIWADPAMHGRLRSKHAVTVLAFGRVALDFFLAIRAIPRAVRSHRDPPFLKTTKENLPTYMGELVKRQCLYLIVSYLRALNLGFQAAVADSG